MRSKKTVDEATILRFEPKQVSDQNYLRTTPGKRDLDYGFLKDIVSDCVGSLNKVNQAIGTNPTLATALDQLKAEYSKIFGTPIIDGVNLNEAYQDRVNAVADAVATRTSATPHSKEQLLRAIKSEAWANNSAEVQLGGKAWTDFVKDVMTALKGRVRHSRPGAAASAAERKAKKEQLLQRIASIIDDSVGHAFPDGDPIDYIMPRVEKLGIDRYDVHQWLDLAARKVLKYRSLDAYLGAIYDDIIADNPDIALQAGLWQNPYNGNAIDFSRIFDRILTSDPKLAVDMMASPDMIKKPRLLDIITNNKKDVLTSILKVVKANPESKGVKFSLKNLVNAGIDWPEIRSIQQSVAPEDLKEEPRAGDILTVESLTQAVVGKILSIESNQIIIEGTVHDFDDCELAENQALAEETKHSHSFSITPAEYRNLLGKNLKTWKHTYDSNTNKLTIYTSDDRADQKLSSLMSQYTRLNEAEYQGREVKLNKPMAGDVKKYRVYVKDPKTGNIKKVNFGDKNMEIKRDDPERRKSFRARHGCGTSRASDKTKAAYWSCKMWSTKPVGDILKGK